MKVVIAYDGSDEAAQAIEALPWSGLPRQAEAVVIAPVQIWPPLPPSCFRQESRQGGKLLRMARRLARLAMSEALATGGEGAARVERLFPGWVVRFEACVEAFPAGLLKKAEEWGAECLFVSDKAFCRHGELSAWRRMNDLRHAGALLSRLSIEMRKPDGCDKTSGAAETRAC